MKLSWFDALPARREARLIRATYGLDELDDTSHLVAHVEAVTGTSIALESLPPDYPSQVTGFVWLGGDGRARIFLPGDDGVYPAHVLHHEIGHVLVWHMAADTGRADSAAALSCVEETYTEAVVEMLARDLSSRLLRMRTPHIERLLG